MYLLVTILLLQTTPVLADPAVDARVDALLSGYEYVPTAKDWAGVGEGVQAVLLARAVDATAPLTRRARAVSALVHFPTEAVRKRLEAWLADAKAPPIIRRKAAAVLGAAFAERAGPALRAAAADPDPLLQEAARRALAPPAPTVRKP